MWIMDIEKRISCTPDPFLLSHPEMFFRRFVARFLFLVAPLGDLLNDSYRRHCYLFRGERRYRQCLVWLSMKREKQSRRTLFLFCENTNISNRRTERLEGFFNSMLNRWLICVSSACLTWFSSSSSVDNTDNQIGLITHHEKNQDERHDGSFVRILRYLCHRCKRHSRDNLFGSIAGFQRWSERLFQCWLQSRSLCSWFYSIRR